MTEPKISPATASKRNFLFFLAAALFYLTAAVQVFSAHRSPQPQMFWVLAALNGCIGTVMLVRGITARTNASRR